MFKETIGNYCENHMKKVHTLYGKVQGSLELRQLAHIVTAGHQKIRTTHYVSPLTGLQGESSTSRLCISSSCRQYFFFRKTRATEQTARFHNSEKHNEDFLSPENHQCYIHLSTIISKKFLTQQLFTSAPCSSLAPSSSFILKNDSN